MISLLLARRYVRDRSTVCLRADKPYRWGPKMQSNVTVDDLCSLGRFPSVSEFEFSVRLRGRA
jgi:hypothetical protein